MPSPSRHLVLLAGPSGSGKTRLVRLSGAVGLRLDDFYRDGDTPGLPRTLGIIDWDDLGTFDVEGAVAAMHALQVDGTATVPRYDIARNARVGAHTVTAAEGATVIAEGIFAPDLLAACGSAGLDVTPVWLDRLALLTFLRRLDRDLREHRKAPRVLVRRGLALLRHEPALRRRALALGFRPLPMREALALLDEHRAAR